MRGRVLTGIFVACYSGLALGQGTVSQTASVRELDAAFVCVMVGTILGNAHVVGLFRIARAGTSTSWAGKWEFSPTDLGGFSWPQLAFWSLLSLFLELLMIRWISSEVRIFAYFKNFVLIACFLGFGLGCYLSRRRINLLAMLVPLLSLVLLVQLPWPALRILMRLIPTFIGASSEGAVWGVPAEFSFSLLAAAMAIIVPIFSLISVMFIPLGQLVGYLENSTNGILAYSVNVAASLAGIMLYTLLCFFYSHQQRGSQ